MAEKNQRKPRIRKSETVRERSTKASNSVPRPRRLNKTAGKASSTFRKIINFGKKEYYLPMPDNKVGRFLNKRRRLIPKYVRESWKELRQVDWPSRKETWKLTLAVFVFAIIFSALATFVDYGLDKLVRKVILN